MEYCPASIDRASAVGVPDGAPSTLWVYTLNALSSRTVSGSILAQTDAGWFSFSFPMTLLPEQLVHYRSEYVAYSRSEFESAPLYVHFPVPVRIQRLWVQSVKSTGDQVFGWDAKGLTECGPQAGLPDMTQPIPRSALLSAQSPTGIGELPDRVAPPEPDLRLAPPAGTPITAAANASAPDELSFCATPFTDASVVAAPQLNFPNGGQWRGTVWVSVIVAIGITGNLQDAWIDASSGYPMIDKQAMQVVRATTFAPGTALCHRAEGMYRYLFDFKGLPSY